MHLGVFLIQSASLVSRCASLSTTFALSQSMTWFSSTAWSVMADLKKSAITDHAVVENHVIDWDKAKVVD